eukprot:5925172-Pleurochrysis_carterae.AAC.1
MGAINFGRGFIRQIGHLANPLYQLVKSDVKESKMALKKKCCARPDLNDLLAEYIIIMTDDSDIAAGASVLMNAFTRTASAEQRGFYREQRGFFKEDFAAPPSHCLTLLRDGGSYLIGKAALWRNRNNIT